MKPKIQDVDLKLLRIFQAVARHQGFSAAQEVLGTTQSAISMSMAQLESRMGVRLCERGVKGFRLTNQGKEVLTAAEKLFASIDDFQSEAQGIKGRVTGTLRIGIIDNVSFNPDYRLPEILFAALERFPELEFDLFVGASQELEERLIDGRIRLAIGLFHQKLPRLSYRPLFKEEHQLFCGASHAFYKLSDDKITDQMLVHARYVGRDHLESYKPLRPPLPLKPIASSCYMEGLAALILSGAYIAYLPKQYGEIWSQNGHMRAIRGADLSRSADISLAYRKSRSLAPELASIMRLFENL